MSDNQQDRDETQRMRAAIRYLENVGNRWKRIEHHVEGVVPKSDLDTLMIMHYRRHGIFVDTGETLSHRKTSGVSRK